MKIQIVRKGTSKIAAAVCPWVIDVPPEKGKQ
jgi:hypothetical protein